MGFRKKESQVDLGKMLDPYEATAAPVASPPSAVSSIRCLQCKRPNVYDARRTPPRRCTWCRTVLPAPSGS